jgi:hypothetical protein
MRLAVIVLLIANALVFAYVQLGRTTGREPDRLDDQLNPNAIRLIGQREAAALGVAGARVVEEPRDNPSPSAAAAPAPSDAPAPGAQTPSAAAPEAAKPDQSAIACLEWGPFSDTERARAEADVRALALTGAPTRRAVQLTDAWWVNVGALTARASAERRLGELQSKSIDDLSVVDYGATGFTVSLGVYRSEAAATARARALAARGVADLRVEPWKQPITLTMLVIRDPAKSVVAQFAALQARYAGTELKANACPVQP